MLTPFRIRRTVLGMADTLNGRAAANIRAEIARRRLRQEDMATALEWPRTVLSELLNERTQITLTKLEQIAGVLDVDPSKLLND